MAHRPQEEAQLWQDLRKYMPATVTAWRIEVRNPPGISDVYWTERSFRRMGIPGLGITATGWVELKSNDVEIRAQQRLFLRDLRKAGVSAWVLAERGDEYYLIDPMDIGLDLKIPYDDYKGVKLSKKAPSKKELFLEIWTVITRRQQP